MALRRILTILMLTLLSVAAFASSKGKPQIKFEEKVYDFGNVRENGGPVTHEFVFTNTGGAPLKISSARAECGCTTPEYPKEEIAPGEKGTIKVTYNPLGRPGGFIKTVTVRSNGQPGKVIVKIRGTVVPKK